MSAAAASVLKTLKEALIVRGVDADGVFHHVGIDPAILHTPGAKVSEQLLRTAWHEASIRCDEPCFGLNAGSESSPHSLGILGYVLINASTVRQAYDLLTRYRQLVFDETLFELTETKHAARIQLRRSPGADPERSRALVEYLFSVLLTLTGVLAGKSPGARFVQRLECRYSRPSETELGIYQNRFGPCDYSFNCHENAIVFDAELLNAPVTHADTGLLKLLQSEADEELRKLATESQLIQKVKAVIERRMLGQTPSIIKVAEDCAMSRATLQRHLAKAGSSFQLLLDEVRYKTANSMLTEASTSISQIAFMLGYADNAAFHHAYKRWAGVTPSQARQRLLAA